MRFNSEPTLHCGACCIQKIQALIIDVVFRKGVNRAFVFLAFAIFASVPSAAGAAYHVSDSILKRRLRSDRVRLFWILFWNIPVAFNDSME
ncbi:hypothetical protein BDN70DRAFT_723449 [Pholiota conissans]|uniref:Uncharacterized protein n=1 Tax=Pholiota conissans TaxID=109636 RepID=A0A9P6CT21_9AGAR|nr:hypothetical protein BDN70DRAFT_723449 [Pholiota conissans]